MNSLTTMGLNGSETKSERRKKKKQQKEKNKIQNKQRKGENRIGCGLEEIKHRNNE